MPTPNLQITHIVAGQDQKEVTANAALDALDKAMNSTSTVQVAGDDQLSTAEHRENAHLVIQAASALAADFNLDMADANKRFISFKNETGFTCTLRNSAGGGNTVVLPDDGITLVYYDGTNLLGLANNRSSLFDVGGFKNKVVNGDGRVQQRGDYTLVKDAYDFAGDRFEGMATGTAVSAGTLTTVVNSTVGTTGFAHKFSGVTLTGTGILYHRHRIESLNATRLKNKIATLSVRVYHDVGSAKTFTLFIRKADAKDDFSAVTEISNDGGTSVANATDTQLVFSGISMGDVTNGIELELKMEVGAITTKNVEITEWQLEAGPTATAFAHEEFGDELAHCERFFRKSFDLDTAPAQSAGLTGAVSYYAHTAGVSPNGVYVPFPRRMRAAPTMTFFNPSAANALWRNEDGGSVADSGAASAVNTSEAGVTIANAQAGGDSVADRISIHYTADAEFS